MFRTGPIGLSLSAAFMLSFTALSFAATPQANEQTKLAEGIRTWQRVKKDCGGNYSYTVRWSSAFGFGHVTEIVVRKDEVTERKFVSFSDTARVANGGQAASKQQGERWVESGDAIGSHRLGAPPKTLDELYAEAEKIASRVLEPHERRYLRFDKMGLPIACFYVDTRIADDAPAIGLRITSVEFADSIQGDAVLAKRTVAKFARALERDDALVIGGILGVPFYDGGKKVFSENAKLAEWFEGQMKEKNFAKVDFEIGEITAFKEVTHQLSGEAGKLMRQVLADRDQLVPLTIVFPSGKNEKLLVLVRIRDGEGSIVGLRDLR